MNTILFSCLRVPRPSAKVLISAACILGGSIQIALSDAQSVPVIDHLLPIETVDTTTGRLTNKNDIKDRRYLEVLQEQLFLTPGKAARCVLMPAFGPEFVIAVDEHDTNHASKYTVTLTKAGRSLYHTLAQGKDPSTVVVTRHDTELRADTGDLIKAVWLAMLQQTRAHPSQSNLIGVDNDQILVSCASQSGPVLWGRFPPKGGEKIRNMDELADLLFRLCTAPRSSHDALEQKVQKRCKELLQALPST